MLAHILPCNVEALLFASSTVLGYALMEMGWRLYRFLGGAR